MASYYDIACDVLGKENDLVVDGDWLSEEEKAGLKIVTDQEWDEMARSLAEYLEMAGIEWINENVKADA